MDPIDCQTPKTTGLLTLIPTPIDDELPLESGAKELLQQACHHLLNSEEQLPGKVSEGQVACLILVEEVKVARRRWLRWGLPREAISKFTPVNEHTQRQEIDSLAKQASNGVKLYLMSDCGLPAVFDPGQMLVSRCHDLRVRVTASPFPHSPALALALSGFPCAPCYHHGFLPRESENRENLLLQSLRRLDCTSLFLDTPYRYGKVLASLAQIHAKRPDLTQGRLIFIAKNLNQAAEECHRLCFSDLSTALLAAESAQKPEFILLLSPRQPWPGNSADALPMT